MGAETAVAVAALGAIGSTLYSAKQEKKMEKAAKAQQKKAEAIQKEQEEQALATRKEQIDQQREGLAERYRTKTTSIPQASGLTGRLDNDILG